MADQTGATTTFGYQPLGTSFIARGASDTPVMERMDDWALKVLIVIAQYFLVVWRWLAKVVGWVVLWAIRISVKCNPLEGVDLAVGQSEDDNANQEEEDFYDAIANEFPCVNEDSDEDDEVEQPLREQPDHPSAGGDSVSELPIEQLELPALPAPRGASSSTAAVIVEEEPSTSQDEDDEPPQQPTSLIPYRPFSAPGLQLQPSPTTIGTTSHQSDAYITENLLITSSNCLQNRKNSTQGLPKHMLKKPPPPPSQQKDEPHSNDNNNRNKKRKPQNGGIPTEIFTRDNQDHRPRSRAHTTHEDSDDDQESTRKEQHRRTSTRKGLLSSSSDEDDEDSDIGVSRRSSRNRKTKTERHPNNPTNPNERVLPVMTTRAGKHRNDRKGVLRGVKKPATINYRRSLPWPVDENESLRSSKNKKSKRKKDDSSSSESDDDSSSEDDSDDDASSSSGPLDYSQLPTRPSELPPAYTKKIHAVGFAPWNRKVLPCMIASPFDFLEDSSFQKVWMTTARKHLKEHGALDAGELPYMVYWFTDNSYAVVPPKKFVDYEDAEEKWKQKPTALVQKLQRGKPLNRRETMVMDGLEEAAESAQCPAKHRTHPQLEMLRQSQKQKRKARSRRRR
ncbi:expressed unknown protein [Seminavis robusta]|uniref:Transmembrane protein n=1 Tax=Seminavis robusta TaxID=568900 RepID=A0A9N8HSL0_9STRA|nr:expressed unknown protein [Seminavis robusta]|eukprot:Sro1536_g280580.1 n/a (620) ;mRNA; r:2495-4449